MGRYRITAPTGEEFEVDGPDNATQADLEGLARQVTGVGGQYPVDTSGVQRQTAAPAQPQQSDSALEGFVAGALKPVDNAAEWLGNTSVGQAIDEFGQSLGLPGVEQAVQANEQMRANNTRTGYQLAGNIAATLPLARLPGGAFTQGAAGGALLSNEDTLGGVAKDAALGGIIGSGVSAGLRGAAAVAAPVVSPALRTLVDAGVRVTPGQIARSYGTRVGNAVANIEDAATSLPILGTTVRNAREASQADFSQAAVNRSLAPINEILADNVNGRDAVRLAGDRLSQAYNEVTPQLTATADDEFTQAMAAIHDQATTMVPQRQEQFNRILEGLGRFWQGGETLSGDAFKRVETRLAHRIRQFSGSPDADQRDLADVLRATQAAMRDLAARQNPAQAERIAQINRGWASLAQAERAAGNSRGEITAAGYSQAVKQSSDTVRRRGYARGQALNQDLADAGSAIIPSRLANSGTADRAGLLALGALGARALTGDGLALGGLGAIGAGSVAYTQPAQALVRGALTRNQAVSPELARLLQYGAAGAPAVAPALIHQR
jgi:hypothetical protein